MSDVTSIANRGKVNVQLKKNGKYRLRLNSLHDDQLELILPALAHARAEAETEYDAVALTCICMSYLSSMSLSRERCNQLQSRSSGQIEE